METRTKEDVLRTIKANRLEKDNEIKLTKLVENKFTLDPKEVESDEDKLFGYVFSNICDIDNQNDVYTQTVDNKNYSKLNKFDKISIRVEYNMRFYDYGIYSKKNSNQPSVNISVYGIKDDQYSMMRYGNIIDADKLVELIKYYH